MFLTLFLVAASNAAVHAADMKCRLHQCQAGVVACGQTGLGCFREPLLMTCVVVDNRLVRKVVVAVPVDQVHRSSQEAQENQGFHIVGRFNRI